ncbi:MAG: hypothetical protein FK730_08270 [Asgard group archaeon]|nr:hypothetical protein [Asgard group archaeon]
MSRDEKFSGRMSKIRLKQKTITIFLLVLCLPIATITSTMACDEKVIDFYIWVERPEKQVIVDEIIYKLECLGLTVNTVYFDVLDDWIAAGGVDRPDVSYGGLSYTWFIDDIYNLAFILFLQKNHMLAGRIEDKKFDTLVDKLTDMYMEAADNGFIMPDEFVNEMVDIFQKTEKRLWTHKIFLPYVQWEGYSPDFGFDILFTEIINLNMIKGHVFSNLGLVKTFYKSIDRNVFLDYHAEYNPNDFYEVYHLYQMSIYHDTNLPNK